MKKRKLLATTTTWIERAGTRATRLNLQGNRSYELDEVDCRIRRGFLLLVNLIAALIAVSLLPTAALKCLIDTRAGRIWSEVIDYLTMACASLARHVLESGVAVAFVSRRLPPNASYSSARLRLGQLPFTVSIFVCEFIQCSFGFLFSQFALSRFELWLPVAPQLLLLRRNQTWVV